MQHLLVLHDSRGHVVAQTFTGGARLGQKIEQLERVVENHLDLCKVTWNGMRCTLPANHELAETHKFAVEFSADAEFAGNAGPFADQERHFAQTDTAPK